MKNTQKSMTLLENPGKYKNSPNLLKLFWEIFHKIPMKNYRFFEFWYSYIVLDDMARKHRIMGFDFVGVQVVNSVKTAM